MMRRRLTTIVVCTALTMSLVGGPVGIASALAPDSTADETAATTADETAATPTPEPTESPEPSPEQPGEPAEPSPEDPSPEQPVPGETAPGGDAIDDAVSDESESDDPSSQDSERLAAEVAATLPAAGRLGGADRYARAVTASKAAFPSGATTVLIANGSATAAPVMAASLARPYDAPLLYTGSKTMPSYVMTELKRLSPEKIVAVGGTGQITERLLSALRTVAPTEHLVMTSSYSGSTEAMQLAAPTTVAYFTGNLQDQAATVGSAAAAGGFAIMINGSSSGVRPLTVERLRAKGVTTIRLVGSTRSIGSAYASSLAAAGFAVSRVDGTDAYARALAVARQAPGTPRFFVANPAVPTDAAVAGALGAVTAQPVVYTPYQCMLKDPSALIRSRGASVVGVGRDPWLRSAAVNNVSCDDEKPRLRAALESAISATAARYPGTYAVSVRELTRVGEAGNNSRGDTMLEPASMMKLYAAWAALKRVQDGRATLSTKVGSTPLGSCIKVMIHASDNYCHTDIVHWIGISNLNRLIADNGFSRTRYGSVPRGTSVLYAGNRTTTDDLTLFLQKLDSGQLLQAKYADVLQRYMGAQIFRSRIASGLPPGVPQESKPGSLWIASGLLQADSAIVRGPQATFAISIIGVDGPDRAALRAITRTVYTHFHGSFGSAATYPVKQMEASRSVSLRSSPGGTSLRVLSTGTDLEVTDAQRVWYKVRWGSGELWVDSRRLRNR